MCSFIVVNFALRIGNFRSIVNRALTRPSFPLSPSNQLLVSSRIRLPVGQETAEACGLDIILLIFLWFPEFSN